MKGVNAVALYGSQAAKGVILITTKKGEANKRKIGIKVNSGVALPKALPEYLNSADYMTLFNEARRNDGLAELYDATTIQNHRTGNRYRFPSVDYTHRSTLTNIRMLRMPMLNFPVETTMQDFIQISVGQTVQPC